MPHRIPLDLFNACEAVLWLAMAVVVAFRYWQAKVRTRRIAQGTTVFLALFAVSDLIEMHTGAWWRPPGLLVLKAVCVVGLVAGFGWLWRHASGEKPD
jgi:hypothetical protein